MGFAVPVSTAQLLSTYTPTHSLGIHLSCVHPSHVEALSFLPILSSMSSFNSISLHTGEPLQTCKSYLNFLCLKLFSAKHHVKHCPQNHMWEGLISLSEAQDSLTSQGPQGQALEVTVICNCLQNQVGVTSLLADALDTRTRLRFQGPQVGLIETGVPAG